MGFPRANKAQSVGYDFTRLQQATYRVIEVLANGTHESIRISKDLILDQSIYFTHVDVPPTLSVPTLTTSTL